VIADILEDKAQETAAALSKLGGGRAIGTVVDIARARASARCRQGGEGVSATVDNLFKQRPNPSTARLRGLCADVFEEEIGSI